MKREQMAIESGTLALEVITQMRDEKSEEEFTRLDKVAQRACSLASSMARLSNFNGGSTYTVTKEQGDAESPG